MTEKRTDLPEEVPVGDLDSFTEAERTEAREMSQKIQEGIIEANRRIWNVVAQMYDFYQKKYYKVFGFENMKDWIRSMGYGASTYFRYLDSYEILTKSVGLELEEYEGVDSGKVHTAKKYAKSGATKDEVKDVLSISDEMGVRDFRETVDERIREKQEGASKEKAEEPEEDMEESAVSDPAKDLMPGQYVLQRAEPKDHDASPRFNEELVQIPKSGIKTILRYDPRKDRYLMEVK